MTKGTFLNYQMAEAINLLDNPPKVKTITKQNNNGFTNYIVLLISSILCILITMIIYLIKN